MSEKIEIEVENNEQLKGFKKAADEIENNIADVSEDMTTNIR